MGQLKSWLHAAPARIVRQTDIGKHKIVAVLHYKSHYAFTILLLLLNTSIIYWAVALTFSGLLKILLIQNILKSSYKPH